MAKTVKYTYKVKEKKKKSPLAKVFTIIGIIVAAIIVIAAAYVAYVFIRSNTNFQYPTLAVLFFALNY